MKGFLLLVLAFMYFLFPALASVFANKAFRCDPGR
jgi:hypothetical protein